MKNYLGNHEFLEDPSCIHILAKEHGSFNKIIEAANNETTSTQIHSPSPQAVWAS